MTIRFRHIVNIASALIVLIGAMIILVNFSGTLSTGIRVAIGIFVSLYFLLRIGQTYKAIRRDGGGSLAALDRIADRNTAKKRRPKSP